MSDAAIQKPIAVPFSVPWMVSPSTPFLRLVASESAEQNGTYVEFVAYYQCEDVSIPGSSITVVQPPAPFRLSDGHRRGPYRLIRISFKNGTWARMCPAHSDTQVVDNSAYVWSQVPGRCKPGEDIFENLRRNRGLWQQSGICPDPGIYEIASSPWLNEIKDLYNIGTEWKHYLCLGHDSYTEVIAAGYKILEGQFLTE